MINITREAVIEQLKSLADHCGSMIDKDDPDNIWRKDHEALDQVINALESEVVGEGATGFIQNAINAEGINQRILADRMGKMRQNINQMMKRGKNSMRYDNFEKLAEALGYEVVLRKNSVFEK